MTPRWPPILGVTGFDFGHKPAISVVIDHKRQTEEEARAFIPPIECPPTINVTFGGVTFCNECYNGMLVLDDSFNGTYELTLDFSEPWCGWSAFGPTIIKRFFGSEDCSGDYDEFAVACSIDVELVDGEYNIFVSEDTGVSVMMFHAVGTSSTLANSEGVTPALACGGFDGGERIVATGGTVVIS